MTSKANPDLTEYGEAHATGPEIVAIAMLQHMGVTWPAGIMLVSMEGVLFVVRTSDYEAARGLGAGRAEASGILARIDGIPNDGGGW